MSREGREQRYRRRLLAAIQRAMEQGIIKPGSVSLIDIEHDPWCNVLSGKRWCNCNPTIGHIHALDVDRPDG